MEYESVIGLEIHSELSTKTKIFCGCTTEFGGDVNTHCCPICSGMPGTLPVMNEKVVEYAVKAGLAMNCEISLFSKQDRKNYFYPDLPKAYQISQYDLPICKNGYLDITVNNEVKRIGITRIHVEEDAGKLLHNAWGNGTLVDMNRCGVPLIEIVTEPDMRSAEEAKALLEKIRTILRYIDVSDCKMQEGSLRCDVNVSVMPKGSTEFGTRTEMKNISSFSATERAINTEIARQINVVSEGGTISQETRRWDDEKGESFVMRTKEDAQDYRYFPEPDLAPIVLTEEYVENIRKNLPELPDKKHARYLSEYGLSEYDTTLLVQTKELAKFFEEAVSYGALPKAASNWILGDISKVLNERGITIEEIEITPKQLAELIGEISNGKISNTAGKTVFEEMLLNTGKSVAEIIEEKGLAQVSDEGAILEMVKKVLSENAESIEAYKKGKTNVVGFLVGKVMKESQGKANPKIINQLIVEELNK
ncbi:MAG: Asp-tRNA(Asn)/Glu-tRNA(Gln) amidotransferase subunit GatB [Clostridia bacterium]|nr:Asp-tRNA(Asn)/Glu-tRNA(Gln) amidotransferase subunit GatB [Clostridia bacterium]